MRFEVEVGSFTTRFVKRRMTVHANNEENAKEKAVEMYIMREYSLASSVDCGSPQVDACTLIRRGQRVENGGEKG